MRDECNKKIEIITNKVSRNIKFYATSRNPLPYPLPCTICLTHYFLIL